MWLHRASDFQPDLSGVRESGAHGIGGEDARLSLFSSGFRSSASALPADSSVANPLTRRSRAATQPGMPRKTRSVPVKEVVEPANAVDVPISRPLSHAAVRLAKILEGDTETARAIKASFHYTLLWRYKTGRRQPSLRYMLKLRQLTHGRIKEPNWSEPASV